jgi:hypothetical protein
MNLKKFTFLEAISRNYIPKPENGGEGSLANIHRGPSIFTSITLPSRGIRWRESAQREHA